MREPLLFTPRKVPTGKLSNCARQSTKRARARIYDRTLVNFPFHNVFSYNYRIPRACKRAFRECTAARDHRYIYIHTHDAFVCGYGNINNYRALEYIYIYLVVLSIVNISQIKKKHRTDAAYIYIHTSISAARTIRTEKANLLYLFYPGG